MLRVRKLLVLWVLLAGTARAGTVIVLDPGHGGDQHGAESPHGALEKDIALELCRKVRSQLLKRPGVEVVFTREKDTRVPLSERVSYANRKRPELFVSVHANSMPTSSQRERVEGIETYFLSANASGDDAKRTAARENADAPKKPGKKKDTLAFILEDLQRTEAHVHSSRLAYAVHQRLVSATGAVDRGVQQAPFYVLMGVEAPAILLEVGFISHPQEGQRLAQPSHQDRLASAITEGIVAFLGEVGGLKGPVATP